MHFTETDLDAAISSGIIDAERGEALRQFLSARGVERPGPRFDLSHLLWYAGACIIIGAMGLFSTLAFSQMGGRALFATAVVYAIVFDILGHILWRKPGLRTPGGLLIAAAVSMAPMAVYGIQDAFDLWNYTGGDPGAYRDFHIWVKGSWLPLEIATLIAAAIALGVYPFPFIVFIAAFALWYLSMDITVWIFGDKFDWETRRIVSFYFGLVMLAFAWLVDLRRYRNGDFAFWLHLFGLLTFWGGMSMSDSNSELAKALYCLVNIGLILLSVFLMRRAYAVFGALGVSIYLGHLASRVFKDSLMFPFALSLIGLAVIGFGILYFRNRDAVARWIAATMPPALQKLRPFHTR